MKLRVILLSLAVVLLAGVVLAEGRKDKERLQQIERSVTADSSVTVSLCLRSGSVSVQGWDKNEVLARSSDVARIELKRGDGPNQSGPAKKLEVLMVDREDRHNKTNDCQPFGDVELMVPHGASVHVQTGDGAINVIEVASVYAKTQTGDIEVEKASQSVEAVSFSSDVSVKDSTGRMSLRSVGGSVRGSGLRPNDSADCFEASTISGDIELDQVAHPELSVKTVNGNIHVDGPLAHRGQYNFNTTTGDVTLSLPSDASFRLNATVSREREITSDFPLTQITETTTTISQSKPSLSSTETAKGVAAAQPSPNATPDPSVVVIVEPKVIIKVNPVVVKAMYSSRRVSAVHGTGDAIINVASFLGTLHLEKN